MTEHAAVVFVFFFLAEYGSIVIMCILTSILGGYLLMNNLDLFNFIHFILSNLFFFDFFFSDFFFSDSILYWRSYIESFFNNSIIEGLLYGLNIGIKSSILIFIFILTRASFPRIRFDQLMAFCWTVLLPILFALIILVPCILFSYNIFSVNINLF
jgi:NADH-ubiquinone oxidoreductase chain 1